MNGGIDNQVQQRVDAYRNKPQELQQSYAKNQQLIDLLALQKLKSEKDAMARQMQMQAQQNPQTIAQQREAEMMQRTKDEMVKQQAGVLQQRQQQALKAQQQAMQPRPQPQAPQGIAAVPAPNMQKMAQGGVVGFAAGDLVEDENVTDIRGPNKPQMSGTEAKIKAARTSKEKAKAIKEAVASGALTQAQADRLLSIPEDVMVESDQARMTVPQKIGAGLGEAAAFLGTEIPEGTLFDLVNPSEYAREAMHLGKQLHEGLTDKRSPGTKPTSTPYTTAPTAPVPAGIAPPDGNMVMQSSQKKPQEPDLDALLGGSTTTTTSTATGGAGQRGRTAQDIKDIMDVFGGVPTFTAPTFTAPEYQSPDLDAALSQYGDKGYDYYMEKAGRTPEAKARIDEMMRQRQETFDAANDPERQRERALINRLVAAGGSRTAGNMFGNMVRAGQRTEDIYDQNRQKALQNMQDFELTNIINPDEEARKAATQAGLGMFGTGLGLEKEKSVRDFEAGLSAAEKSFDSALKGEELNFTNALNTRKMGLESLLKSEATDADLAAVDAKNRATESTTATNELYRYMAENRQTSDKIAEYELSIEETKQTLLSTDPSFMALAKEVREAEADAEGALTSGGSEEALARAAAARNKLDLMLEQHPAVKKLNQEADKLRVQQDYLQSTMFPNAGSGSDIASLASRSTVSAQAN